MKYSIDIVFSVHETYQKRIRLILQSHLYDFSNFILKNSAILSPINSDKIQWSIQIIKETEGKWWLDIKFSQGSL